MKVPYFNKKQRIAVVVLVGIICVLQLMIFGTKYIVPKKQLNVEVDAHLQQQIDSLKQLAEKKKIAATFNPNFINYERGFRLGMNAEEVDKLMEFRSRDEYVNSALEFQQVTGISDSLLNAIAPLFKFPEWTQTRKQPQKVQIKEVVKKLDLNSATYNDLISLKGIGDYFATAVLTERERLGGFVSVDQLGYIRGLRPEAVTILKKSTFVGTKVKIEKVQVNKASREQLAQVPYITASIAREIVLLRSKQDEPLTKEDLVKISNFPLDKIEIIEVYLTF